MIGSASAGPDAPRVRVRGYEVGDDIVTGVLPATPSCPRVPLVRRCRGARAHVKEEKDGKLGIGERRRFAPTRTLYENT